MSETNKPLLTVAVETLMKVVDNCLAVSKEISDRLTLVQELATATEKDVLALTKAAKNLLKAAEGQDKRIAVLEEIMLKEVAAVKSTPLPN